MKKINERQNMLSKLNLTINGLSELCGLDRETVSNWLNNPNSVETKSSEFILKAINERRNILIKKRKQLGIPLLTIYTYLKW